MPFIFQCNHMHDTDVKQAISYIYTRARPNTQIFTKNWAENLFSIQILVLNIMTVTNAGITYMKLWSGKKTLANCNVYFHVNKSTQRNAFFFKFSELDISHVRTKLFRWEFHNSS